MNLDLLRAQFTHYGPWAAASGLLVFSLYSLLMGDLSHAVHSFLGAAGLLGLKAGTREDSPPPPPPAAPLPAVPGSILASLPTAQTIDPKKVG